MAERSVIRELVGFVRWDGDEYHDFLYYTPGNSLDVMARTGYYEVFVERVESIEESLSDG